MLPPLHGILFIEDGNLPERPGKYPFTVSLFINSIPRFETTSQPIWQLIDEGQRYCSKIELYCTEIGRVLDIECEGRGQFILSDAGFQISWEEQGTGPEHYLQTLGASLYLEQHSIPCIHANAIVKNGAALLLMAPSRTGKSTLSAKMVQSGYNLFTDDMVALYPSQHGNFVVYPSWSKLRLWPDSAQSMFGTELANDNVQTKRVHERFSKQELTFASKSSQVSAVPVKGIYYLDRSDSGDEKTTIKNVPASEATMLLLQNSMLGNAYTALGLEKERLGIVAEIIKAIPMYKVTYQSGFELLNNVVESIDCHSQQVDS